MSHSLRIGGATALYQATADIELVKRIGTVVVVSGAPLSGRWRRGRQGVSEDGQGPSQLWLKPED